MQVEIVELEKSISQLETKSYAAKSTNYEVLYKNWGRLHNQEERRKELLEVQKSNRNNKFDSCRDILQLVSAVEKEDIFHSKNRVIYRPTIYVAGFHKTNLSYSNVLMLSEWMVEKPENFSEDWYLVPCPKAKRTLVVTCWGKTKFYSKFGKFIGAYVTRIPGGNRADPKGCCVLDTFYCEQNKTVYVLDLLVWNNQPMTDGETEFRQYWLKSKFEEIGHSLETINKKNEVIFKLLPMIPCTPENLNENLSKYPFFENDLPTVDGLLFYHKKAHYVSGETPLVGWLFPYMVPEIIGDGIKLHFIYESEKPKDYVDLKDFIPKFSEETEKKRKRQLRSSMNTSMETEVEVQDAAGGITDSGMKSETE